MTLHDTTESAKKLMIGGIIGATGILSLVIVFRIGIIVKNILFPPRAIPPNVAYGELAPIHFPSDAVPGNYTYDINTFTGTLPEGLPDRLNVFPIVQKVPGLNNLKEAKSKIATMGLVTTVGTPVEENPIAEDAYEWVESTGLKRKVTFNIVSFDFTLKSDYLESLDAISANHIKSQDNAIDVGQTLLEEIGLKPNDLDLAKTSIIDKEKHYVTTPRLYSINTRNGTLETAESLSTAQVIRVDFYQKDVKYDLNTGLKNASDEIETTPIEYPILYPNPPYSTMSLLLASGANALEVVDADFTHQDINLTPDPQGIYPIKTVEEAYEELRQGKAYIAAYNNPENTQILINSVYLAYYMGKEKQDYLMPIFVFEGKDGFFAYISAVK